MFSHAYVLGSIFFTCFILSSMCLCAPCHVCMPRPRLYFSCHVLLLPFCHFCLCFLHFGLLVWTRSRPYSFCHRPYPSARSPKRKQKGRRHKHVDISQAAMFSSFRSLASPIRLCTLLNLLPSSLISLLDGLY